VIKLSNELLNDVVARARHEIPRLEAHIPASTVADVTVEVATDHLSTVYRVLTQQADRNAELEQQIEGLVNGNAITNAVLSEKVAENERLRDGIADFMQSYEDSFRTTVYQDAYNKLRGLIFAEGKDETE